MIIPSTISIEAVVTDAERNALTAALDQFGLCLDLASGVAWSIQLQFFNSISLCGLSEQPTVIIASLLPEVRRTEEELDAMEKRWRESFLSIANRPKHICFVCTIFRYVSVASVGGDPGRLQTIIEPIRRLNMFSAELSLDTGVNVIDLDRTFAHVGARTLGTDFQLTGPTAAALFADTIISALLTVGLDEIISVEFLDRAQHIYSQQKFVPPKSSVSISPELLGFDVIRTDKHRLTFSRVQTMLAPATVNQLLRDLRKRRITWRMAYQIALKKIRALRGRHV